MIHDLEIDGDYAKFVFEINSGGELMIEFELDFNDVINGLACGYMTRAEAVRLRDFLKEKLA